MAVSPVEPHLAYVAQASPLKGPAHVRLIRDARDGEPRLEAFRAEAISPSLVLDGPESYLLRLLAIWQIEEFPRDAPFVPGRVYRTRDDLSTSVRVAPEVFGGAEASLWRPANGSVVMLLAGVPSKVGLAMRAWGARPDRFL